VAVVDHVLRTERLILRPVTAGDHAALLAHWAAPDVSRFLFDGATLSASEITEAIEDSARDFGRSGYGLWLIHEKHHADLADADPPDADLPNADPPDAARTDADPADADPADADPPDADPADADPPDADPPDADLPNADLADAAVVGTAGLRPLEDIGLEVFYSLAPGSWGKGYATEAARAVLDRALGPLGLPEVLAEIDAGNTASIAVIERLGMTPFEVVPGLLGPMTRYRKTR
jgi:RimJ/RimL family protein N-acetyltransferase